MDSMLKHRLMLVFEQAERLLREAPESNERECALDRLAEAEMWMSRIPVELRFWPFDEALAVTA